MPNSLISHQAPGLFLKMKFPKIIDGTAICLSAFVPDLNFILEPFIPFPFRHVTHSLLGLLIWVTPITILMTILFSKYVGPRLSDIAKKEGKISKLMTYFGFDELHYLKKKKFNKRFYIIASFSALIGGLSHILIDLPGHAYNELFFPWTVFFMPEIFFIPVIDFGLESIFIGRWEIDTVITLYEFLWVLEDIILLGISLFLLRKIKNRKLIEKEYTSGNSY